MPIFTVPQGIKNVAIGAFDRSTGGAQAITGLGFKPKVVILFSIGVDTNRLVFSNGVDDAVTHCCVYARGDDVVMVGDTEHSIMIYNSTENFIRGYVSSMDADGFTITWDLTGAMIAGVLYLAMA